MSALFDVLKVGSALEGVEIDFTEVGFGDFSFIVMHDDKDDEFPQKRAGEFKGRTADEAALVALQWARQNFPEVSLLTVDYLVQHPQFGMDSPFWKITFMGLEGELPLLVKS